MYLQNFLNSAAQPIQAPDPMELSEEQFKELTIEIDKIREKILSGAEVTVEEARQIVIWFRARRKKNFTVQKAKAVKAEKPKRRAASNIDALELLNDL